MTFSIGNYDELMALHRVIMEAKFCPDPNDLLIQGSPLVSAIANRVVEVLKVMDLDKEGEAARQKWQEWRQISPERREYRLVKSRIRSDTFWKNWNLEEQKMYVRDLVSPLQISDELINQLLNSVA
jgi:hypothetical protein